MNPGAVADRESPASRGCARSGSRWRTHDLPRYRWPSLLLVSYTQAEGFGTTAGGVRAFAASSSPLSDLARTYVATGMAIAIALGATVSAFASALGTLTAGARILFVLGCDGFGPAALGRTHPRYSSPYVAVGTVIVVALIVDLALIGQTGAAVFGYLGTIGVLSPLLVYAATQVSAIKLFRENGRWRAPQFLIPAAAIVLIGYTFYSNVHPAPAPPSNYFPHLVVVWIVIGLAIVFAYPGLATRIGRAFVEREAPAPSE